MGKLIDFNFNFETKYLSNLPGAQAYSEGKLLFELWIHVIGIGLGLLCAILDWEHFASGFGCGKHFSWVKLHYFFSC